MTEIDLDQHRQALSPLLDAQTIQTPSQFQRVERVDDVEKLDRAACLVCLEMSDQVPARGFSAHFVNLLFSFLNAILTDVSSAESYSCSYHRSRMCLGDRDYRNLMRQTSAF